VTAWGPAPSVSSDGARPAKVLKPVILITGAGGQLGRELLRARWSDKASVCGYTSAELDIRNPDAVGSIVDTLRPDVIVNAAAYTAVDRAEDEPEEAEAVNVTAVKTLANAANHVNALLVHISTDYVFNGTKAGWYTEADPISPIGVYGRTKADGEQAAEAAHKLLTLRTSWVYGALGSNFVTTMLRLGSERDELGVVADQVGCPTSAGDLARAITAVAAAVAYGTETVPRRLYHLAGPDAMTWFEFAQVVFASSRRCGDVVVRPITTDQYPTRAARPANSRLDSSAALADFGVELPPAARSIANVVGQLESAPRPDRPPLTES